MELFILRHGIAVERGTPGYEDDRIRPLTKKGRERLHIIARTMKEFGISFDVVLSSPYERAKQTAAVVSEILDVKDSLRLVDALTPDGDDEEVIDLLREEYAGAKHILLVGHEPYLSGLIARLLAGEKGVEIILKKGGLCKLKIDSLRYDCCATLEWLMTPKWMIGAQ